MVDLHAQYLRYQAEIDCAMQQVLNSAAFIGGTVVQDFAEQLATYLNQHSHAEGADPVNVVPCGNGTDALHLSLMALGLQRGDEVIVPAFTYAASAEVIALLGLTPVLVDVDPMTFCTTADLIAPALTPRTRAIIVVHLFGQCADMEPILELSAAQGIPVVEDNAQSLGAVYTFSDGRTQAAGTMGTIGCTSFFPTKPLGCYGDGGACLTRSAELSDRLRMLANHGQRQKYRHDLIGCNSRLDALQAAVLNAKLPHLDADNVARHAAADRYTQLFLQLSSKALSQFTPLEVQYLCPMQHPATTHVYHQYTLRILGGKRDALRQRLAEQGIPTMVYYPLPLHHQPAFSPLCLTPTPLVAAERLCTEVLSLPIGPDITAEEQEQVVDEIKKLV